jgi:hypothetical protein
LGKTVFPNSSQISAFFGYTIRSDDHRRLLLGQTSLKTHELGGATYLPHAFYQSSPARTFELPFDDPARLDRFKRDFRLVRDQESGLSVVIPYAYREITENSLIEAAIEHYFFPILAGRLVIRVNDRVVDKSSIMALAAGLHGRKLKDIEKALVFALDIQRLPPESTHPVDFPARLNTLTGRVPAEAFSSEHLASLRQEFRDRNLVAVKIPVTIESKSEPPAISFITIVLKSDPSLQRGHDYYLRGGITLSGQSVFGTRPALGLLLADHLPVCKFLGDAENPAHTLWNPRSARLSTRYRHSRETVMFIREAMVGLLDTLTQVSEDEDRAALAEIFYTPRKRNRQERGRTTIREELPEIPSSPQAPKFILVPSKGGFKIKPGPGLTPSDLPLRFSITTAYEVRRGNPFKKYDPNDYCLEKEPIKIDSSGTADLNPSGQNLEFTATATDFALEILGFDYHRDLKVRVEEDGES